MSDVRSRRISRELFAAAVGSNFGGLEPWVTDRLAAMLEEPEVSPGDCIFAAGEPAEAFYFVRQGRVEVERAGRAAEIVDGPRAFGLLDVMVDRPHSTSARARSPLQLLRVRANGWFELLEDSFDLARMSVLALVRAVAALEERAWASGTPRCAIAPLGLFRPGRPLDLVEEVALLMRTFPLAGAGVQPLSDLAAASNEVEVPAGGHLFERGAVPQRVFALFEGCVEADRRGPDVRWTGGPGQIVCGTASLGPSAAAWEARAVTPVRAVAFELDDWLDVMEENFEMVRATLATLAVEHERLSAAR